MRILITNDDGIYSPGILSLAEAASGFGDVRIVAPDVRAIVRRALDHCYAPAFIQTDADRGFRSVSREWDARGLRRAGGSQLGKG